MIKVDLILVGGDLYQGSWDSSGREAPRNYYLDWESLDVAGNSQKILAADVISLTPACDFEPDCDVDLADLAVVVGEWLDQGPSLQADIHPEGGDEIVDLSDFAALAQHWMLTLP